MIRYVANDVVLFHQPNFEFLGAPGKYLNSCYKTLQNLKRDYLENAKTALTTFSFSTDDILIIDQRIRMKK